MSEEYGVKTLIQYMSAIALALFYLIYIPFTGMSGALTIAPAYIWIYYFTLVIGLLFPLYYAIGKEKMAWLCLGLSIMINSVLWILLDGTQLIPAFLFLLAALLIFLGPLLEGRMANKWDLIKNVFQFLEGLFIVLAIYLYAGTIDGMVGNASANHIMPQFIFMGGAIMVAFAVSLMMYGLFKLFKMYIHGKAGGFFGDLANIFYMLMVISFLLGIVYNAAYYPSVASAWLAPYGPYVPAISTSMDFLAGLAVIGASNLGAILLIILFIYGMGKIAKKFE